MKKKRLKIGIFMDSFYPAIDGVVVVIDSLARALARYHDVTVVVPYTKTYKEDYKKEYKIIRIDSIKIPYTEHRLGLMPRKKSKIYKELLNERFDVIHIHSPFTMGKLGIKLAHDLNIPCIGTVHTRFEFDIKRITNQKWLVNKVMKFIINVFNKCDKCIVVNEPLTDDIKKYGYKYEPVVIHNGTDLRPLEDVKHNLEATNKIYKLENKDIVLLYVGRIIDYKNIFFILDALKLLKEDNIKFKMLYVGSGPDEDRLKTKIKQYHMEKDIILTGRIEDRLVLSSIYARADLLLFPSLMDTSSLVRIEAAVNKTPGLFIKDSMVGKTIEDSKNGFLSELDEVKYKNRIKEIINNKDLLKKVSINAQKTLGISWEQIANITCDEYLKSIEEKNK
ncbi:MAG: glycosyltransferase family 4 protein [Firmicutes bacterium]|nr:glycosyltransferase family 4 protein [Bacillota bacterium]